MQTKPETEIQSKPETEMQSKPETLNRNVIETRNPKWWHIQNFFGSRPQKQFLRN